MQAQSFHRPILLTGSLRSLAHKSRLCCQDTHTNNTLSEPACRLHNKVAGKKLVFLFPFLLNALLGPQGSGIWKVALDSQDAGGPHTIMATSVVGNKPSTISLEDVLFGDVWICSGQSNMAFTVTQVNEYSLLSPYNKCFFSYRQPSLNVILLIGTPSIFSDCPFSIKLRGGGYSLTPSGRLRYMSSPKGAKNP